MKMLPTSFSMESLIRRIEPHLQNIEVPEVTITKTISWGSQMAMIFGGMVPFIPQYIDIKRTRNTEGFSTFVCLNLLIANILRILFWFGKHYEFPLLAQSILMIGMMLTLVHLCVTVKHKSEIIASKPRKFSVKSAVAVSFEETVFDSSFLFRECKFHCPTPFRPDNFGPGPCCHQPVFSYQIAEIGDFDRHHFWKWTDFFSYVQFILFFTVVFGSITFTCLDSMIYVETLGFCAVFAEALLGAPQFYRNYENKSTAGMSKKMVGMWTCGDIFKTCYFILREAPAQFWVCGMLQVAIDISIFIQVIIYRHNVAPKAK